MGTEEYQVLYNSVIELAKGEEYRAHLLLSKIIEREINIEEDSDDLLIYLFAKSLMRRIDTGKTTKINLYLQSFEIPQIHLFNLLANSMSLARIAGQISNQLLAQSIVGKESIALCNIGIGTGRQELALFQELQQRNQLPKRITIYAIEPSAESIGEAQRVIETAARRMNFDLIFYPFVSTIEDLSEEHWQFIEQREDPLIVNAAFSLHHIRDRVGEINTRNQIISKIHRLRPDKFVLCEPYSNHYTSDLHERFLNCWHHFSLLFRLINELALTKEEKFSLKMFFSREIEDILGNSEEFRTEKHETGESWLKRFTVAGFVPCNDLANIDAFCDDIVECSEKNGFISLNYEGESIVAILSMAPA
ncbi:GRAS family protein [Brevibacillus sp. SYSU BS000544]|uniref:GRAS family protein n=1 Tax=Brevibacillus sp. SYSU BS000544 TaxID=3416443 RepID=UPI003CE5AF2A